MEESVHQTKKVSVVIPARNKARTVYDIVKAARVHCDEVIVVDDGSIDATAWLAEEAGLKIKRRSLSRISGGMVPEENQDFYPM